MWSELIWHDQLQKVPEAMNATQTRAEVTKEVFEALLLIYASHTDFEFSKEEKEKIIFTFGQDNFQVASNLYDNYREYELLKNICDLRNLYYPGPVGKNEVLDFVKNHFMVDGQFSVLEKTQYNFLRMML